MDSRSPLGMTGTSDGQGSKSSTRSRACRSAFVTSRGRHDHHSASGLGSTSKNPRKPCRSPDVVQ
jgi:hypothetical protein